MSTSASNASNLQRLPSARFPSGSDVGDTFYGFGLGELTGSIQGGVPGTFEPLPKPRHLGVDRAGAANPERVGADHDGNGLAMPSESDLVALGNAFEDGRQ